MSHEPNLALYEKVATIAWCRSSGTLGIYVPLTDVKGTRLEGMQQPARIEVALDDYPHRKTFIVWCDPAGMWHVTWRGFEGVDHDIEEAARMALGADDGSDVSRELRF